METIGILEHDNDIDIFCLHFVAFPLIEAALVRCQYMWNNHKMRTEREMTPNQLFISGLTQLAQEEDEENRFTELEQVKSELQKLDARINNPICLHF